MRYIDLTLPPPLEDKLWLFCKKLNLNYPKIYEELLSVFGLLALRETLRVIKIGGRVRFGGYVHHFQQGKILPELIEGMTMGGIKGVSLDANPVIQSDSREDECNVFILKTAEYIQENIDAYIIERLHKIMQPALLLQFTE